MDMAIGSLIDKKKKAAFRQALKSGDSSFFSPKRKKPETPRGDIRTSLRRLAIAKPDTTPAGTKPLVGGEIEKKDKILTPIFEEILKNKDDYSSTELNGIVILLKKKNLLENG